MLPEIFPSKWKAGPKSLFRPHLKNFSNNVSEAERL